MSYAKNTSVPIARSQDEIRRILSKYGGNTFAFADNPETAMVQFELNGKRIKYLIPLGQGDRKNNAAQVARAKWRCLVLVIKAKLESVASGITTLEQEFMSQILLPNGETVGDVVLPEIENSYNNKQMPPLLGMR